MSNRAFGVEIECYAPDGNHDSWTNNGVDYTIDLLKDAGYSDWASLTTIDESLENGYGVEVKSPPLSGTNGYKYVKLMMNFLSKRNFWVDESCGFHVHVDAPEFVGNSRLIKKAVKAWMRNQELINNMVAQNRTQNSHCEPWSQDDLMDLERCLDDYNGDTESTHRGTINVGSLSYHGSIEIRQHEGTLNPEEAVSWIKFCQAFVDTVTGTTIQKISSEELFLKRLKVERNASRFLTTKARLQKEGRTRPNRVW